MPWRRIGEWRFHVFLTSALDAGEWSGSRPGRFILSEIVAGTHWTGGCVGPRTVVEAVRRESNPRTPIVQPVAQRYTDWAIMALMMKYFTLLWKDLFVGTKETMEYLKVRLTGQRAMKWPFRWKGNATTVTLLRLKISDSIDGPIMNEICLHNLS
jgi:hypothetical protein